MGKVILLISNLNEDQAFAAAVSQGSGLPLKIEPDMSKAAKLLTDTQDDFIVLADVSTAELYQKLENAIQESIGLLSDKINANAFHFIQKPGVGERAELLREVGRLQILLQPANRRQEIAGAI